jgi:signal transduction histidine kinase
MTTPSYRDRSGLEELKESATELGDDLRTLSHRLHSSTLQILGLDAGLRALCKEFSSRQNIHIEYFSEDIPPDVNPDVATCLFRITQEALHNLKKHSGAAKAEVSLRGLHDKLFLSVRDEGRGLRSLRSLGYVRYA